MTGDIAPLLEPIAGLARRAGDVLRAYHQGSGPIRIAEKSARDFVTEADLASQGVLLAGLRDLLPDVQIISEEQAVAGVETETVCYVDPLDGTTNFAHRHPAYSISIGLVVAGVPALGVVYAPATDELFAATRTTGATLNGARICVSTVSRVDRSLLCAGFSVNSVREGIGAFGRAWSVAHAVRHGGSAALDLAYVAAGRYDGFWEVRLRPWDIAAGLVLVAAAGGTVTGFGGGPVSFTDGSVVATNGAIGPELLALIG